MAYIKPTPSDLKSRYPAFATVSDATVQSAIDEASRMVDESWTEGDYATAIMLAACHTLASDGCGTSAEAKAVATGTGQFETIRSGQLTLTRGSASTSGSSWWAGTSWGRRFLDLLRRNKAGPRVVGVFDSGAQSGYAKDVPFSPPWGYR